MKCFIRFQYFLTYLIINNFKLYFRFQQSLYVGYGLKSSSEQFYPKVPQMVMDEPKELFEQFEPRENVVEKQEGEVKEDEA